MGLGITPLLVKFASPAHKINLKKKYKKI